MRGLIDEDLGVVAGALEILRYSIHGQARVAFQNAAAVRGLSDRFRRRMLNFFLDHGDALRGAVPHEFLLLDFLRAVLPRYAGPSLTLHRGTSFQERRRRTYGSSWTANEAVARHIAEKDKCRTVLGGSVVLKTDAPASAVICAPALVNNRFQEDEYIVDRRRLRRVDVTERFPWLSIDKYVSASRA